MEIHETIVVVYSLKCLGSCSLNTSTSNLSQLPLSLSTGTPLWSSSCSLTPSWALLCLKLWVFSVWWLHFLFCLPCELVTLLLWKGYDMMQTRINSWKCLWMVQWVQLMLPFFFHWRFFEDLLTHWCMALWQTQTILIIVLPLYCIFNQMSLLNMQPITEIKYLIHHVSLSEKW